MDEQNTVEEKEYELDWRKVFIAALGILVLIFLIVSSPGEKTKKELKIKTVDQKAVTEKINIDKIVATKIEEIVKTKIEKITEEITEAKIEEIVKTKTQRITEEKIAELTGTKSKKITDTKTEELKGTKSKEIIEEASVELTEEESDLTSKINIYKKTIEGKKVKWIETEEFYKNDTLKYVSIVKNNSAKEEHDLKIINPIAENLIYVNDSAVGEGELEFSIDNGKTFDIPENLYVKKDNLKVKATNEDYTSIKWTIKKLKGNTEVEVSYQVKARVAE